MPANIKHFIDELGLVAESPDEYDSPPGLRRIASEGSKMFGDDFAEAVADALRLSDPYSNNELNYVLALHQCSRHLDRIPLCGLSHLNQIFMDSSQCKKVRTEAFLTIGLGTLRYENDERNEYSNLLTQQLELLANPSVLKEFGEQRVENLKNSMTWTRQRLQKYVPDDSADYEVPLRGVADIVRGSIDEKTFDCLSSCSVDLPYLLIRFAVAVMGPHISGRRDGQSIHSLPTVSTSAGDQHLFRLRWVFDASSSSLDLADVQAR